MNYKVTRRNGGLVCYGPNTDSYDPVVKDGEILTVEEVVPTPRPLTLQERDDELTSEANQAFDLTPKDKTILKQLFLIRKQLNPALTQTQFRAELISDYKSFK